MKKGIIVLLITVLAAGMVFAADPTLSGSVTTTFKYNLDENHDFGFNAEGSRKSIKTEFKFSFDTVSLTKGSTGENKPYAEIEATASVSADDVKLSAKDVASVDVKKDYIFNLHLTANITKANIVGEGWKINLLGAKAGSDYAKAAIDLRTADYKKYVALDFVYDFNKADGVTVTVDKYGTVAVGLTGDKDNTNASIYAETAADLLKFDDFALQFAGTFTTKAGDKKAGASAKAAYTTDALSAGLAADFGYDAEKLNADVAVNAGYKQEEFGLTFDAYYATYAKATKGTAEETNYLGAQIVGDVTAVKTNVTVQAFDFLDDPEDVGGTEGRKELNVIVNNTYVEGLDVTVSALNLVKDERDVSVEATISMIDNLELTVYGNELINKQDLGFDATYTGIEKFTFVAGAEYVIKDKELGLYGQVNYAADLFTAYARAEFAKADGEDAHLGLSAGVESTKLIDNATLSLTWAALKNGHTTNDVLNKSYGEVVAACKISF